MTRGLIHLRRGARAGGPRAGRRAFTLVELIVALLVGVVLAGATAASLSQFTRAKSRAAARQEAGARAHGAAARIAEDVRQVARERDLLFSLVRIADGREGENDRDSLLLWVRSMRPTRGRPDVPEGADAEVQYKLLPGAKSPALWRRADAPPDRNELAGGVAQVIAPGVVSFSVQATDGAAWFDAWDSDRDGYPHGLRITVTAAADDGRTTAIARRTIALDRTPLPPPLTDGSAEGDDAAGGAG